MAILYIYILLSKINSYWLQYIPLLCCDVGLVSELRLTAGYVLMDLASPAASQGAVYANGLNDMILTPKFREWLRTVNCKQMGHIGGISMAH